MNKKDVIENVEAELTTWDIQLSVPLETNITTM